MSILSRASLTFTGRVQFVHAGQGAWLVGLVEEITEARKVFRFTQVERPSFEKGLQLTVTYKLHPNDPFHRTVQTYQEL